MTGELKTAEKRKPGRPSLGKRGNFTFRVRDQIREKLIEAAASSDVSVSEEIERRIEQSFSAAGVVAEMFGGVATAQLMSTMAFAVRSVEMQTGKNWNCDAVTHSAAMAALMQVISLVKRPVESDDGAVEDNLTNLGRMDLIDRPRVDTFAIGKAAANAAVQIARDAVASSKTKADAEEKS